jgi:hypothetical protein
MTITDALQCPDERVSIISQNIYALEQFFSQTFAFHDFSQIWFRVLHFQAQSTDCFGGRD